VRLHFGPFTLDTETRQLLRDGSELHLSPKAFELLWSLVEQRLGVSNKRELRSTLCQDIFVV
jgi:DNA-binding winged helix-turn-helix (wHTH) protein